MSGCESSLKRWKLYEPGGGPRFRGILSCHSRYGGHRVPSALVAIFIELGLLLALRAESRAGGYSRRVWQTQGGLPQDTINALV